MRAHRVGREEEELGDLLRSKAIGVGVRGLPAPAGAGARRSRRAQPPFRFDDKRFDSGSRSIEVGARRYEPDDGRFLQQDVARDAGGDLELANDPLTQNRYGFASGNPVSFVDENGHRPVPDGGGGGRPPDPCAPRRYPRTVYPIPCPFRRDFNAVHPTAGLENYAGIDFFGHHTRPGDPNTGQGLPIVAIQGGTIRRIGAPLRPYPHDGQGNFDIHGAHGWKLYLHTVHGLDIFYTHLGPRTTRISRVGRYARVGQLIGTMINFHRWGNRDHVHIGVCRGTPSACGVKQGSLYRANIPVIQAISHAKRVNLRR